MKATGSRNNPQTHSDLDDDGEEEVEEEDLARHESWRMTQRWCER